ncbi:MAG: hypothetical protein HQP61_01345 [Peptococcaceae bacterium]|nr:hypothetical protein [Candidatus Syntrophopropionicum ammoniitolerans]
MKDLKSTELKRWRWYAIFVTVLGILLFAVPWITNRNKIALVIPLYAMFVYVYYRYLTLKKAARTSTVVEEDNSAGRNSTGKSGRKSKMAVKKGQ